LEWEGLEIEAAEILTLTQSTGAGEITKVE
jgi:hypothetical protein